MTMTFSESVEYLYNLGNEVLAMKLGLENIRKVLDALDSPEKNYLKVQIAGTNGKGSTCAFLEAICVSAGINVGLTTSPHLISITERVKINGQEISEKDFARHATRIKETSEKLVAEGKLETVPTFFEQITAIALNAFAEEKIDLAILETGLGGRFDATTAAKAEIVAITPIDFDHQNILGNSLAEIAAEKAAIIREDTKVIVASQPKDALDVILERCAKFGVAPNLAASKPDKYKNIRLNLLGRHQIENAKVAVLLAETLQDYFPIKTENIIEGLETAVHKGRLEFYKGILFDGAHNVAGAKALKNYLDEFIEQPITMIFGAMRDKDLSEISEILFPKADKLILTKPDNPRSALPKSLAEFAKQKVYLTENVGEALDLAKEFPDNLTCVTGSLYLIGEAQKILKNAV